MLLTLIFVAFLTPGGKGQPQVVPAQPGLIPDGSVPFRRSFGSERRIIPAQVAKVVKNDDIPRQADDSRFGISPSLAELQRLAGIQGSNTRSQAPSPFSNPGNGASLAGLRGIPGLDRNQLQQLQALQSLQGSQGGSSGLASAFGGSGGVPNIAQLSGAPRFGGTPTGSVLPSGLSSILGGGSTGGGLGGTGGLPAGLSSILGGGGAQNLAGLSGLGAPQGQTGGLLNILGSLGGSLGRSLGIGSLLGRGGGGQQFSGGSSGPTFAGVPAVPGIPLSGLTGGGGGQGFNFLNLIGSLTRRAFNGSSVTEVLPPQRLQSLADNVTDSLIPDLSKVDLTKYMGRWFEGINSPRATEHRCPVHHYGGLTENGQTATFTALKIYREGSEFGQVQYSIGYAFRGGRAPGMLQMHSSATSDPAPYWIYHTGPVGRDSFGNEQYEYAVVSNWIKYPTVVLVRDPDVFKKQHYVDVLRWLEDNGFIQELTRSFNLLSAVDYSNCQYEDSTFEVFGK